MLYIALSFRPISGTPYDARGRLVLRQIDVKVPRLRTDRLRVQAGARDHVSVDEEGGTTIDNPKMRFLAPALALMALSTAADLGGESPAEAGAAGAGSFEASNVAGRGLGGFYGLGLIGAGLSQLSRPVAFGLAAFGAVHTVYGTIFGMGKNVSFPADTPIQVQLAPGPGASH